MLIMGMMLCATFLAFLILCLLIYKEYIASFHARVKKMNKQNGLPVNKAPTIMPSATKHLSRFKADLSDKINSIDDAILMANEGMEVEFLITLSCLIGEIMVICESEAVKHGIPIESVLTLMMDEKINNKNKKSGSLLAETRIKMLLDKRVDFAS